MGRVVYCPVRLHTNTTGSTVLACFVLCEDFQQSIQQITLALLVLALSVARPDRLRAPPVRPSARRPRSA